MRGQPGGLWRNPDFVRLWLGQTVSEFGSYIGDVALSLTALLVLHATPGQMGLLGAARWLPILVVGLPAGVWVDRLPRRLVMISGDLGRALLLGSIPLAAVFGVLHIEQLYIVALLVGAVAVFFHAADQAYLPTLVPAADLIEAKSKGGVSESLAEIGGPSLAGLLVQAISAPLAILFDVASFVVSAVCVALIRKPEPPPAPAADRQSLGREMVAGLRLVLGQPVLRALAGSSGTFVFFGEFIGTLYNLYLVRELAVPPAWVGVLVGLGGIGALIGALLTGRVVRRLGLGRTLGTMLIVSSLINLTMLVAQGPLVVVVAVLGSVQIAGDVAIAIYLISESSLRAAAIPNAWRGRGNATFHLLALGGSPVGALLAGALGEQIGVRPTLLIGILGIMLSSLWIIFSPVWRLREQPVADDGP